MTYGRRKYDSIEKEKNSLTNWQLKMKSALASLAILVSETPRIKELLLKKSKKMDGLVTLLQDESSNTTLGGKVRLDKH